jgi:hypothetical protein
MSGFPVQSEYEVIPYSEHSEKNLYKKKNIGLHLRITTVTNKKQTIEAGIGDKIYSLADSGLKTTSSWYDINVAIIASLNHYRPELEWKKKGSNRKRCPYLVRKFQQNFDDDDDDDDDDDEEEESYGNDVLHLLPRESEEAEGEEEEEEEEEEDEEEGRKL